MRLRLSHSMGWRVFSYAVLLVGAAISMGPFIWMVLVSFMNLGEALASRLYPSAWHPENYLQAWNEARFSHYMLNSVLITVISIAATIGALTIDLVAYESFLLLLGSFFVPLFAVLLADWLLAGRRYTREDVFEGPAWRPGLVLAWVAGFVLYQWLSPTGPGWWVDQVERLDPPSWTIGATVPSFAVSFGLGLAAAAQSRRPTTGTVRV